MAPDGYCWAWLCLTPSLVSQMASYSARSPCHSVDTTQMTHNKTMLQPGMAFAACHHLASTGQMVDKNSLRPARHDRIPLVCQACWGAADLGLSLPYHLKTFFNRIRLISIAEQRFCYARRSMWVWPRIPTSMLWFGVSSGYLANERPTSKLLKWLINSWFPLIVCEINCKLTV